MRTATGERDHSRVRGPDGSGPGGTFAGSAYVITNASGVATAPAHTANTVGGNFAVYAWVAGVNTPASFSLNVTAGTPSAYRITAGSTTPTAGAANAFSITLVDQYGNVETGFSGTKTLTFSELSNSGSGAVATVTNASLTAVKQGMATAITFTEGVSSAGGVLTAYDAKPQPWPPRTARCQPARTAGSTVTLTVSPAASHAYTIAPHK